MYVRLYLNTENHQLSITSLKLRLFNLQLLYMTAVWESDMLDIFLRFRLNWSTDPTFFKLSGKLFHNVAPP